jgi:ElaB/YqjD/DUF883 family membrane-anchored ribosome-binding protein
MTNYSGTSPSGLAERLFGAAKNNPEGLLLLAAGCALLMRTGSSSRPTSFYDGSQTAAPGETGLSQAPAGARQQAREVAENVKDAASSYAATASKYAADAGRAVTRRSSDLAYQAQQTVLGTFNRIVQDQPLLSVGIGLALGAAIAAVFPATELEKRSLRPVGESLSGAAATATERLKTAATAAGERLVGAADERGLNAEGLKEIAHEATDAFGKGFSGEQPGSPKPNAAEQPGKTEPGPAAKPGEVVDFRS